VRRTRHAGRSIKEQRQVQELDSEYEVIIVGGRPAGASLAARLGELGVATLVIDKAEFPSEPSVPSCAVLYPQAMKLLDELGIDEHLFGDDSAKIRRFIVEMGSYFQAKLSMMEVLGRDYVYGIERATFDATLWEALRRYASVTAREGMGLVDLLRDDEGRVVGVKARDRAGHERSIRARCVVGADGRFSTVARKAGARVREDFGDRTSTVHFATWEDVAPLDDDPRVTVHIFTTARGSGVLFFPKPQHRVAVCTHVRSDRVSIEGDATAYYLRMLESLPPVARRLEGARRIDDVVGLKRVANRYLDAGGPGWVLVGDALHHKDPVDGQGVYDALLETKILAEELRTWRAGEQGWDELLVRYDRRVREGTHGMFLATMERLRRELYAEPPVLVIKTLLRWLMNDEEYQRRFILFLCRALPPDRWLTRGVMGRAVARGMLGDLRRVFQRSKVAS
jgi:2-polyprenyl-6-methoxyphenol hydroxylase-like FAD-dependent oxidoreductase